MGIPVTFLAAPRLEGLVGFFAADVFLAGALGFGFAETAPPGGLAALGLAALDFTVLAVLVRVVPL